MNQLISHPVHGLKMTSTQFELEEDLRNGWVIVEEPNEEVADTKGKSTKAIKLTKPTTATDTVSEPPVAPAEE